jgi:predicted dehydrogenase
MIGSALLVDHSFTPNILIIGAGSIGRRHAKNCARLGAAVSVFDIAPDLRLSFCRENGFKPISDVDLALKSTPFDAAIVCTPNHLHIAAAQKVADAKIDLFIEKPLSHTFDGVPELISTIEKNNLIAMAGFNLRFEPGLRYLKQTVDPKNVAFVQIESGSHMPTWRPGADYRNVYSSKKSMGGGIILDDVHELDYACWLFGYPDSVLCSLGKFSNFEIDVEDTAAFHFKYSDKLITIHSDYLQKRYTRKCKICYRDGRTTEWKFGDSVIHFHDEGEEIISYKDTFDINNLYLDEMKVFFDCINTRLCPESDIKNAAAILRMALDAKNFSSNA